jgi:hypothetical protein
MARTAGHSGRSPLRGIVVSYNRGGHCGVAVMKMGDLAWETYRMAASQKEWRHVTEEAGFFRGSLERAPMGRFLDCKRGFVTLMCGF